MKSLTSIKRIISLAQTMTVAGALLYALLDGSVVLHNAYREDQLSVCVSQAAGPGVMTDGKPVLATESELSKIAEGCDARFSNAVAYPMPDDPDRHGMYEISATAFYSEDLWSLGNDNSQRTIAIMILAAASVFAISQKLRRQNLAE
jgi:hypothetical protein